ncbi:MAG: DUF3891 family protein [Chloroflexota bacterium]
MIRVPYDKDGEAGFLLIPQPAHAMLSGLIAEHWATPLEPAHAIMLATTLHDIGWLRKDTLPLLNDEGAPLHFLDPTLEESGEMYIQCVVDVRAIDPYAALLVKRHIETIFNSRVEHGRDSEDDVAPYLFRLQRHDKALRAILADHPFYTRYSDESTIERNYRILRTCDFMSLFVCGAFTPRTITVPFSAENPAQEVACELVDSDTLRLTPSPLAVDELTVPLTVRYINKTHFGNAEVYAEAFQTAERMTLVKRIIAG